MPEVLHRHDHCDHHAVSDTHHRKGEQGHLMVGLVFMIAVMLIMSTVVVQEFASVRRRDNEAEMMFRAQEIVRAILRYQKDRGTFPTELKQLDEPGSRNQRFIRRMYDDPLVKDGEWGLLFAAPGGGVIDPNQAGAGDGNIFGDSTSAHGQPRSGLPGGLQGGRPVGQQGGLQGGQQGGLGGGAQTVGGLTIVGVKSLSTDKPFRVWNGLTAYADWQFTVYELQNQQPGGRGNTGAGGQGQQQNPGSGGRTKGRPGGGTGNRGRGRGGNLQGN
jgi:type II secretory pathway pseudopilin PulG